MSASTGEQRGGLDSSRRYSVPVVLLIVHQTISSAQWLARGVGVIVNVEPCVHLP